MINVMICGKAGCMVLFSIMNVDRMKQIKEKKKETGIICVIYFSNELNATPH